MNEYVFYTTEGFTYAPNENYEVENCQVLGCAVGSNANEAQRLLLKENQWINEAGFSVCKFDVRQVLTNEQRTDIRVLIDYITANKEQYSKENYDKSCQISNAIKRLSAI